MGASQREQRLASFCLFHLPTSEGVPNCIRQTHVLACLKPASSSRIHLCRADGARTVFHVFFLLFWIEQEKLKESEQFERFSRFLLGFHSAVKR